MHQQLACWIHCLMLDALQHQTCCLCRLEPLCTIHHCCCEQGPKEVQVFRYVVTNTHCNPVRCLGTDAVCSLEQHTEVGHSMQTFSAPVCYKPSSGLCQFCQVRHAGSICPMRAQTNGTSHTKHTSRASSSDCIGQQAVLQCRSQQTSVCVLPVTT